MKRIVLRHWKGLAGGIGVAFLAMTVTAGAATDTWSGGSTLNGNWSATGNWAGGVAAGSADTASFTTAIANGWGASAASPIVIDSASQAISSILFDTGAGSYTLGATGGNALTLTSGGTTQIKSTISGVVTETLNAPLVLGSGTAAQSYTFLNGAASTGTTLNLGGQISGGTTGTATLTLGGANAGANTVSGSLVNGNGTLALLKSGTGTWVLTGTGSTYTGATTIYDGTLRLGASNALSSASAITLVEATAASTATLDIGANSQTVLSLSFGTSGAATGASYQVTGAGGTLTLGGGIAFSSTTGNPLGATISVSTLSLGGAQRVITTGAGLTLTISSAITDGGAAGSLAKTGYGTLVLTGNNTYTGGTAVQGTGTFASVLAIGNNNALGTGVLKFGAGTVQAADANNYVLANAVTQTTGTTANAASTVAIYGVAGTGNLTFTGGLSFVSGSAYATSVINNVMTTFGGMSSLSTLSTLVKEGTGAMVINGAITSFSSKKIDIQGGMFASTGSYPTALNVMLDGGVLGFNGTYSPTLGTSPSSTQAQWVAGSSGGFAAFGANATWGDAANNLAVNIGGSAATLVFGTTSSFLASGSTLILGNASSNGTVTFKNGLDFAATGQTVQVDRGSSAPTAGVDAVISGALVNGSLTKTGAGTLQLTGVNTYSGGTTIAAGTLLAGGSGTLGTGAVHVAANSAINATLGGVGTISGAVTVGNGTGTGFSVVDAGGYATIGTLTLAGGLTFGSTSELAFELNSGATTGNIDTLVVSGTLTLGGTVVLAGSDLGSSALTAGSVLVLAQTDGLSGTFSGLADGSDLTIGGNLYQINYGSLSGYANDITLTALSAVPEPSVSIFLSLGGFALALARRRGLNNVGEKVNL